MAPIDRTSLSPPIGPPQRRNKLSLKRKADKSDDDTTAKRQRLSVIADTTTTMNGHNNGSKQNSMFKSPQIASLCNLGNTCYLNSVLYTLRFTPGFLHSLHHMVSDLGIGVSKKMHRNGDSDERELVMDVLEQMHDLFKTLSAADESHDGVREPIPPSSFLNSIGKLNPMFEGNHQQDAHELLVMLLNMLQDIKIPATTEPPLSNGDTVDHAKKTAKKKNGNGKSASNGVQNGIGKLKITESNGSLDMLPPSLQKSPPPLLPNFVKENFEGKSVMRTRCLECEMSTFRSESFTNIDIPLHFDEEDDEMLGKDLFLKQIMASETLRENNKYWCEQCCRLNEAQRSVQYELLPRVLVLQLKRFTATGSKAFMSKINDYIPTPFGMSCFCIQCMKNGGEQPRHKYRLYAVIMHLGATLASGHYIAYVRAADPKWDYVHCPRANSGERKKQKGIMKYFSRSDNTRPTDHVIGVTAPTCRSAHCCGMRVRTNDTPDDESDLWLECDDESVAVVTQKQFEELLSSRQGATTPYLLFYQRV